MKHKEFISQLDEKQIVAAIADAELKSSGEIRIFVSHRKIEDAMAAAKVQFGKLGMEKTGKGNGVLLYFAPVTQQFAVLGDVGVHEKCGDTFWGEVSAAMTEALKRGEFTEAVLEAVKKVGDLLARHFPHDPDDKNELPNGIVRD